MAEMFGWPSHPNEFGRTPDDIDLYDTRELYWLPTNDTRRLRLLRYRYIKGEEEGEDVVIGQVGSATFALFGETTTAMCPEDVYGLHCCRELEMNEDPRAPRERSASAGRKLPGL
jgi:hypothetical protein